MDGGGAGRPSYAPFVLSCPLTRGTSSTLFLFWVPFASAVPGPICGGKIRFPVPASWNIREFYRLFNNYDAFLSFDMLQRMSYCDTLYLRGGGVTVIGLEAHGGFSFLGWSRERGYFHMYGLRKPITAIEVGSISIPNYSVASPILRSATKTLFLSYLPGAHQPWPQVRAALAQRSESLAHISLLAFHLQLATCCRASEILQLKQGNYNRASLSIDIFQSKTRQFKYVHIPEQLAQALDLLCTEPDSRLFPVFSYKNYVAALEHAGLTFLSLDQRHDKTHILRYLPSLACHDSQVPLFDIQCKMGHNREESTLHYLSALPDVLNQFERQ
jgi:hypothetical protein